MPAIRPSDLVQELLQLDGMPFSIKDYPYLVDIYNSPSREIGFFTARQVAKSTFLASKLVMNAALLPQGRQVLVSPLMEQAHVFSMQRLKDFIHDSPLVKQSLFSGPGVVDQVLRKVFSNGHMLTLGYAQRTADRLRGQSIKEGLRSDEDELGASPLLGFDELQDILPDVIPVVKELAFRAKNVSYMYCGTPKSHANHMERYRARSTDSQWAVKCEHCGHWNYEWDERNVGDEGVVCCKCQKRLGDTNRGEWIRKRQLESHLGKSASVTMEAWRIPQLIVKPIMDDPLKWRELLDKMKSYSTEKFRNEVLGLPHDSAAQPITYDQLVRCCKSDRPNALPRLDDTTIPHLCMGVDWAFIAENSYTFIVLGAWTTFPTRFDVYYYRCFKGHEADVEFQVDWIIKTAKQHNVPIVGADWGCGQVQNIQLVNGLGEDRVAQLFHTSRKGAGHASNRVKWDPRGRKWHLARTRVLTDTFEGLKGQQVILPRQEDCGELIDHILAEHMEMREETQTTYYTNIEPDDGLHALTFAMLAGELYLTGGFDGHMGSTPISSVGGVAGQPDQEWIDEYSQYDSDVGLYV